MASSSSRFRGKVAVITASTQGIGLEIARRLGSEGASVVISSRKQSNVDEAVQALKSLGIDVLGVVCHVSNAAQRKNLIKSTIDKYGRIDVLVSNAASNPSVDPLVDISETAMDKLWEINVKAAVLVVQAAAPYLSDGASIVLISSIAAYKASPGLALYGVTKTALLGLTKGLAVELAPKVRVNAVAPGFVPTHFASFLTENLDMRERIESETLLKKLGRVEDMGAAVAFLASDDASYITGETLVVAGGMQSRL